ncbi:MAG: ribonuclease H-like domain-containing protein [Deltaproteobacteria bacterium]|nr:ribonuclease H-like domain-containing protein [Deltaproteobacteria bacterium]
MPANILVLDLETKNIFQEVGGGRNVEALGVSVAGVFCYRTDEYQVFAEQELGTLEHILAERPLVVGFNIRRFDLPVLRPYLHFDPGTLPMCDMLEEMQKVLGHRVSLNSVAQATLGTGKSGSGLDAVEFYRRGEVDKLKRYCLDDVKITRQVFEYGAQHQEVFYTAKFGPGKGRCPVTWTMEHPETDVATQATLF